MILLARETHRAPSSVQSESDTTDELSQQVLARLGSDWDDAPDFVLAVDAGFRISYANKRLRGVVSHALYAQSLWSIIPEHEHSNVGCACRTTMETGLPSRVAICSTGWTRQSDVSTFRVHDRLVLIFRDLGADPRPTAELPVWTNGDFLSCINHEIRTPLSGVMGHANLLLEDETLNPQQRRHTERIKVASSALLSVADNLLNFATLDPARTRFDWSCFDLNELLATATAATIHQAELKGLVFELTVDPGLPTMLMGDLVRIRQILQNLLNNAAKFTSEGRIRLTVDGESRNNSVALRFSIADTGIGFSPGSQSNLFERGDRRDFDILRQSGGVGLGLLVSKRLIREMGGAIEIESVPDLGTTVRFEVVLAIASSNGRQGATTHSAKVPARAARILLVEDHDINQEIARSILEAAGHHVDVASDGSEALMAVQNQLYDLVLMDVQMPILDGVSATRLIRSLPGPECDVPIVALTANVLPDQVRSFKAAGMCDHIGKPFQPDELLGRVNRWAFDEINTVIRSMSYKKQALG